MKAGSWVVDAALLVLFLAASTAVEVAAGGGHGPWPGPVLMCPRGSPCFHKWVRCPRECPFRRPWHPYAKSCYIDCYNPKCEAVCKGSGPCDHKGSGCKDPRFIGGDGVVFYFHGRKDNHFALVSDSRFQINARFIGLRPTGRTRDFTWIQALGFIFGSHTFTVEAARAKRWNDTVDHLRFSYDGELVELPQGHKSSWRSPDMELMVERMGRTNNITVKLEGMVEASVNVVPVTEEDDRIHKYQIPSDDCFAHLDVQFSFYGLSSEVEGVLGRTYQPDYVNPAKRGVAIPVLGGADKYWTPSLLSPQCSACVFSPTGTTTSMILQIAEN
ncbi:hypothetical protein Taro_009775 [Colocasia esculenta]|uniref:Uncharacterized protein n=1 Tax=Colocasia esculenta TaxID=4460 RepID=A0A843U1U9_COLES|nr:hypothetical protein [Colocasia esculenta]